MVGGLTGTSVEKAASSPKPRTQKGEPVSLGQLIYERAMDLGAKAQPNNRDAFIDFLEPTLAKAVESNLDKLKLAGDVHRFINDFYKKKTADTGQYEADTQYNKPLAAVLLSDPLIDAAIKGKLGEFDGGSEVKEEEKHGGSSNVVNTGLELPSGAPQRVRDAKDIFDSIVSKRLPAIKTVKRKWTPESAQGHEDDLHVGWGSPTGAILHEFGHHLEHYLTPVEIASVHNFLRARSKGTTLTSVGMEPVYGGTQSDKGYDIEHPDLDLGGYKSLWGLTANVGRYLLGSDEGAKGIDRFIMGQSDTTEHSYSTKIYRNKLDTEYLSTTIHFFNDPETAAELVAKDPLRVAMFLSVANPTAYQRIRSTFAKKADQAPDLDSLIHRMNID